MIRKYNDLHLQANEKVLEQILIAKKEPNPSKLLILSFWPLELWNMFTLKLWYFLLQQL